MNGPLLALILWASPPAPAAASETPAKAGAVAHFASLTGLLKSAGAMARQWSAGAKLYSILGSSPGNPSRWEPERWEFYYGDPETKDGMFHVFYENGALAGRKGVKGGVAAVERYNDGKLVSKAATAVDWTTNDYDDCRPVSEPFLDAALLDAQVRDVPMSPDELGRFRVVLLRAKNDKCDGLGHISLYLTEKPIPAKMRGKTIWVVTGPEETVFFTGATGEPLLKRLRKPTSDAPKDSK
ncbi:MAG: hypothetical protein FD126_2589 [Elusimicrobia bacterium]|nr:MAG: hypothetical protein FD126_2589 [Elusimicrobiota bacterium]